MPLTCECSGYYEWMYFEHADYDTARTKERCSSCRNTVSTGETVAVFEMMRFHENGDEEYGEDITMCEECSDIFFSLEELGFCVSPDENMKHLLKEYVELRAAGEFW